jgi:CxC6 like cysteine cluster associated with KDZ transposases
VCDGVTIGHYCCQEHDCKEPLLSSHSRYCKEHDAKHAECAVKECTSLNSDGYMTCTEPKHRSQEDSYKAKGKALFQLQQKLQRTADRTAGRMVPEPEACEGKPIEGNCSTRAQFSRHHTHNEQFIIRSCGMIVARATFFGSEAVSSVHVSQRFG